MMTAEDWGKYKNATECHNCNSSLIKDEFLDSVPVCDNETGCYCGQSHKGCYYVALKKNRICWAKKRKKRKRQNRPMDCKQSGNMVVLRRTFDEEKLQRCSKGPLPHNGKVPWSRAQRMQSENANKTQDGPNTSCISQPEGLRRTPFNASDVTAAERGQMRRQQHGEIHHIFSRRSAFHSQLELFARKP